MNPKATYTYSNLTGSVIGCAMRVHSTLGCGFPEIIYQRSLAIELKEYDISYEREVSMPLYYNGIKVGSRKADFIIEYKVLVEG